MDVTFKNMLNAVLSNQICYLIAAVVYKKEDSHPLWKKGQVFCKPVNSNLWYIVIPTAVIGSLQEIEADEVNTCIIERPSQWADIPCVLAICTVGIARAPTTWPTYADSVMIAADAEQAHREILCLLIKVRNLRIHNRGIL